MLLMRPPFFLIAHICWHEKCAVLCQPGNLAGLPAGESRGDGRVCAWMVFAVLALALLANLAA